jgi:hypothetical protein
MYYRVAIQGDQSTPWQWKSTALSSLDALFRWLRLYAALKQDRLRVFSSSSREEMHEQLKRENHGLLSTSVTAAQFLRERRILCPEVARPCTRGDKRTAPVAATTHQTLREGSRVAYAVEKRCTSPLEKRRGELEGGAGGDHDMPYQFSLPASQRQALAWMRLQAKVQRGELQL